MIFWHVGGTLALTRYTFRDAAMDVRLLVVGALLPDLIDKPLGRIVFQGRYDSGRLWGHTLLFSAVLLAVIVVVTKRGSPARRTWIPLAIGSLLHLFLDGMWLHPETLLWPALGTAFSPAPSATFWEALLATATDPLTIGMEVIGLTYLVWLWRRADLGDSQRRRQVLTSGDLGVPIGG